MCPGGSEVITLWGTLVIILPNNHMDYHPELPPTNQTGQTRGAAPQPLFRNQYWLMWWGGEYQRILTKRVNFNDLDKHSRPSMEVFVSCVQHVFLN